MILLFYIMFCQVKPICTYIGYRTRKSWMYQDLMYSCYIHKYGATRKRAQLVIEQLL